MKETIKGTDKLLKALKTIPGTVVNKILRTELRAGTKEIAADIKELAPVGETGVLRRAIRVRASKKKRGRIGFEAQIGEGSFKGDSYYGAFVDLGTSGQKPQHFMERGFEKKADELKTSIPTKIWAGIKNATKGGK